MQRVEPLMYPEYYESLAAPPIRSAGVQCAPIRWVGPEYIDQDIANLKRALDGVQTEEAFMPAVSPARSG